MAATYDFALNGDPATAHQVVLGALSSIGHRVSPLADGTFAVARGSEKATFWLGALSGKNFHTRFSLQFFDGAAGTVARFTRVGALGGLKGGVIGASKTTDVFHEAARTIDAVTRQSGILGSVTEHA
ncbi:hypothetical protein [Pseudolysinimonas sp.]|jgi:hypothetical protein|uniref:hypothetical protein n=1 Tax=Pseudolysinimonas sp. TaxID=2680009 RepID=UPI003783A3C6